MILVDIFVPVLNEAYDFCLDENATVASIIEEVAEMICRKERWSPVKDAGVMLLSSPKLGCILPPQLSLKACGIDTGYKLILT